MIRYSRLDVFVSLLALVALVPDWGFSQTPLRRPPGASGLASPGMFNQAAFNTPMMGGAFAFQSPAMNPNFVSMPSLNLLSARNTYLPQSGRASTTGASYGSMMNIVAYPMSAGSPGYGNARQGNMSATAAEAGQSTLIANQRAGTVSNILDAMGVANEGGRISWPFELRVMGPSEVPELRKQLEGLLQVTAEQAATGHVDARILEEANRVVARLDLLLLQDKERGGLGMTSYADAKRFLDRVRNGLRLIE